MHTNAHAMFLKYAAPLLPRGIRVLESGIGRRWWRSPYYKMAKTMMWDFSFCDLGNFGSDQPGFIEQTGEYTIAGNGQSFDAIISQQQMEHVRKPWRLCGELGRMLKPGGLLIVITPITWKLHPNKYDCWRVLPDGMRVLLDDAGCDVKFVKCEHLEDNQAERDQQWVKGSEVWDCLGIGAARAR